MGGTSAGIIPPGPCLGRRLGKRRRYSPGSVSYGPGKMSPGLGLKGLAKMVDLRNRQPLPPRTSALLSLAPGVPGPDVPVRPARPKKPRRRVALARRGASTGPSGLAGARRRHANAPGAALFRRFRFQRNRPHHAIAACHGPRPALPCPAEIGRPTPPNRMSP